MALCKAMILFGALLVVPTFQMRIKQVKELVVESIVASEEGPEADKQDMELTLERLRQRYAQPEMISPEEQEDRPTRAKQATKKLAAKADGDDRHAENKARAKADGDVRDAEDKARAMAEKEKANGPAKKIAYTKYARPERSIEKMVAQDQGELAKAAGPEADKQERAPAVAEAEGSEVPEEQKGRPTRADTRTKERAAKADGHDRHAAGKAMEKPKKEEKAKEHAKKVAADKATVEKAPAEKPAAKKMVAAEKSAAKKIVAKAGGDAPKALAEAAVPEADNEDMELTLERLRQRYAKPELILDSSEEQKDRPTRAKQMAKKWEAKADGDARNAEDKASAKAEEEKASGRSKRVVEKSTAKIVSQDKKQPAQAAGSEAPEEQKGRPTRAKQEVKKRAAKEDGDARHAEDKAMTKRRRMTKGQKEEKASEHAKMAAVNKATPEKAPAEKLAAKKIVAKAGGDAPKVVAEAAGSDADKQDIELTLQRLRQRYMQPEVISTESPEPQDQPTRAKQMAKKLAAKVILTQSESPVEQKEHLTRAKQAAKKQAAKADVDARLAEDKARENAKAEEKARAHSKKVAADEATAKKEKVAADKAIAEKAAAEKVAAKKLSAKVAAEKVAAKKLSAEKEKAAAEKVAAKTLSAKAAAEKAAAKKLSAKVAADKAIAKKAAAEKVAAKKLSAEAEEFVPSFAEAEEPEADEQDIELVLERLRQRYMQPEMTEAQPTRAQKDEKKRAAKADGDARHAEDKARATAKEEEARERAPKKISFSGDMVGILAAYESTEKMLAEDQEELAKEAEGTHSPVEQKHRLSLGAKKRVAKAKQAAEKSAAKADRDARYAEDKARAKAKREVKAEEHAKKVAADKASAGKAAAERPAAKKVVVETGGDAPKAVAFSKRRPRRNAPKMPVQK